MGANVLIVFLHYTFNQILASLAIVCYPNSKNNQIFMSNTFFLIFLILNRLDSNLSSMCKG